MTREISGMSSFNRISHQRLTQAQKDAKDFQWYKDRSNELDHHSFSNNSGFASFGEAGTIDEYTRRKVNYDLFNNQIDDRNFAYVCKPYGAKTGDLPANFKNRDIVSPKIKVLLGMEMKMPFSWKVVAVNEDATTRREQEEFGRIRDWVVSQIMQPIRQEAEQQAQEQFKGRQLTTEEQQQMQDQIAQQTQAKTPDEVRKYMTREHQDPAEILAHQLLEYLIKKERVADKFNKGFKHLHLSGLEVYSVGVFNGEPGVRVTNSLMFDYDASPDLDFIEDGEWAVEEIRMTPTEVISQFGSELDDDDIDRIYQHTQNPTSIHDSDFTFDTRNNNAYTIRVLHTTWKALMKIGFLIYMDQDGKEQLDLVNENYKLDKGQGDISIQWEWIPEAHETYKIMNDIYVYCRPVPGQNKSLDNLWSCHLPYYGAACDNLNSQITSTMDRMIFYQYLYDVIIYRIELLMASDKGKILVANINAIPKSAGIDINKFHYFMEANHIAWLNPQEEGNRAGQGGDVTTLVKEIDMSLMSDINKYMAMAEYIDTKCGASIGVTKPMEGAIGPNDAVSNTRQNIQQSSHIIQPIFELHNIVKGNVLTALLETAKVAYSDKKPRKLSYILDDMSLRMLTVDQDLLDNSEYGLFVANSSKAEDAKQAVIQLSQAAMQNQQADLVDIIKVIRSESVTEAEELLTVSVQKKQEQLQAMEQAKLEQQKQTEARADQLMRDGWEHEGKMIVLKEEERRKTEIQKQTIMSMGFDTNKDEDNDGIPDVLEVAKFGVDAEIKREALKLNQDQFKHEKVVDNAKMAHDKEKLRLEEKKINKPTPKSK